MPKINVYLSELFGTFFLVFIGCGAIVVNDLHGGELGHLGVSMSFGLIVMIAIYAVGNVSGAHLNPAVTLGFFFAKRIRGREVILYIILQVVGAVLAAGMLKLMFAGHDSLGSTLPKAGVATAFIMETVLSFILMFVVLNVSTGHMEKGIMAGVAVGGTIMVEALVGGPISGASMNPARSIAPGLLSGQLQGIWIYLLAPILGTFLAAPLCSLIQGDKCCE